MLLAGAVTVAGAFIATSLLCKKKAPAKASTPAAKASSAGHTPGVALMEAAAIPKGGKAKRR